MADPCPMINLGLFCHLYRKVEEGPGKEFWINGVG